MNLDDGQKHLESLLEVHVGTRLSQVLRHLGTRFGQDADWVGFGPEDVFAREDAPDKEADADPDAADSTYVVTDGLGFDETEMGICEFVPEDEDEGCGMTGVETEVGLKLVTLPTHAGHSDELVTAELVELAAELVAMIEDVELGLALSAELGLAL